MKKFYPGIASVVILVLGLGVVFWLQQNSFFQTTQSPAVNLVAGKSLYQENCAVCHGVHLEGQPNWRRRNTDGTLPAPPHDSTGHTWHHDMQMLFDYTKLGGAGMAKKIGQTDFSSGMPAFADSLSDQQIRDILAYIESTWPQEVHDARKTRGL